VTWHRRGGRVVARQADTETGLRTVRTDIAETDAVLDGVAEAHALLNGLRNAAQDVKRSAGCPIYCLRRSCRPRRPIVGPGPFGAAANSRLRWPGARRQFGGMSANLSPPSNRWIASCDSCASRGNGCAGFAGSLLRRSSEPRAIRPVRCRSRCSSRQRARISGSTRTCLRPFRGP